MSVEIGMKGRAETVVTPDNTARAAGSGLSPVFATPWMVALMENAAVQAVQGALAEDQGTVGTHLDISHDAASPIGMKVWAEAEVTAALNAFYQAVDDDEAGRIGGGTHQRFIIQPDRFLAKVQEKLNK